MTLRYLLLAVFLPAGFAQSVPSPSVPPMAHAKLLLCDGLPCLDAAIGGKHLRLGLDTGNPNSFLDLKAAQSLGLDLQAVNGADGKPIAGFQKAVAKGIIIGGIDLPELKFAVFDMSAPISKGTFPHVDGTIAYGAFKDRLVQLDYAAGIFSLSPTLTGPIACPGTCGDISLITFGRRGPPIVTSTGFTLNGKALSVQIDTMFTGTLLVFPSAVDKLELSAESKSETSQYFPFTDEGVDMFQSQARQLGFGLRTLASKAPLYFAGPKVHLPDGLFDGTVGHALLAAHKATFDFHDNKFWLE